MHLIEWLSISHAATHLFPTIHAPYYAEFAAINFTVMRQLLLYH